MNRDFRMKFQRQREGEGMSDLEKLTRRTPLELATLSTNTGMPIRQHNGQRIYGPPPYMNMFQPPKGSEIYVSRLPRDCIESELIPLFQQAGRIYKLRMMMDFSGFTRGYCFIQYFNRMDALQAVTLLNGFEIRKGHRINVAKSVDNCRLYVGNIPKAVTKEQIFEEISRVTDAVVRVIAYPTPTNRYPNNNSGFAFVEYQSHKDAAMARRKLLPGKIQMWGSNIIVDWAEPEPEVKVLYVRNLHPSITEKMLRSICNLLTNGGVDRVRRRRGLNYAFIHFLTREAAEFAKELLDQTEMCGIRFEVMWAKYDYPGTLKQAN